MIKIAFVGNPNVGKTALINKISNASLKMGNWPGVTIEKKEVFFKFENEEVNLVDLPGIYSLTANTPEELVSRDFILENDVDVIINVVESTALEKNLYLTALLKEIGKPMVMALNYHDEFKKLNYQLDKEVFEKQIGMETVFTSGKTGEGVNEIISKAVKLAKLHKDQAHIPYTLAFDNAIEEDITSVKKGSYEATDSTNVNDSTIATTKTTKSVSGGGFMWGIRVAIIIGVLLLLVFLYFRLKK